MKVKGGRGRDRQGKHVANEKLREEVRTLRARLEALETGRHHEHTGDTSDEEVHVTRNISPFADKSCSSGLNGSDPEQMSEQQIMKTLPGCRRYLECYFNSEPMYLQLDET